MKKTLLATAALLLTTAAAAQLYVPGETLHYRMSYRAKLFPNTEVAKVIMQTTETTLDGIPAYKVYGYGQTTAAFRWILPVRDAYTVWVDPQTLRTRRFDSNLHEGDYTFRSSTYTPAGSGGRTRRSSRRCPYRTRAWMPYRYTSTCVPRMTPKSRMAMNANWRWFSRIRCAT